MPNSGVVAFRIEASPLAIRVWPHRIRLNGTRLFSAPMARKARQARASPGILPPPVSTARLSASAATPTRPSATVSGGRPESATLPRKNEPPQIVESASSSVHSAAPITGARDGSIGSPGCAAGTGTMPSGGYALHPVVAVIAT